MLRRAARVAVVLVAMSAGCGGDGGSTTESAGVEAFPDVLEIARSELGETATLHEVTVTESLISFVNVQLGRNVRVKYDAKGVAAGSERIREPINPAETFSIAEVPADAPARLLAEVDEREDSDVEGLTATLRRGSGGALAWTAKATVDGAPKTYEAALDGSVRG